MKTLIWKELRENIKWVPLPGLVVLLVFLIDKPDSPMPDPTDTYFFCLTAVVFGAALGFLQIYFESQGDKRSILIHRPLSPSRMFLAKALTGVGLYILALGIPFVCLESWYATPGNMPAPFHWQMSLSWLADILSGLVYYFAGMLVAQREARWYGSRALPLAAAFFCSYLVWALPEFWQALLAIVLIGSMMAVAAWGCFQTGGAYEILPRLAKVALAMTLLTGLLVLSMKGKQFIGESLDPAMHYQVDLDRQGQVFFCVDKEGKGEISITDINGQPANHLMKERYWRSSDTFFEWPVHWGYRHNGRFYVQCQNESKPGSERWYYDHLESRLIGYDGYYRHVLGSFGPDGFTPAGQPRGKPFQGDLRFMTNRWQYILTEFLILPGGVYDVDFTRRSIRMLFTPATGETVINARRWWDDPEANGKLVVVNTNKSINVLQEDGSKVVSMPREFDWEKYGPVFVGRFENPRRYYVWYHLREWLREPEEYANEPSQLIEYDTAGRELARRTVPPFPYPGASYANAMFGLLTPMTEAAALVGASRYVRAADRANGSIHKSSILEYLEYTEYYIPGTATMATVLSPATQPAPGLIPGYIGLILLSAGGSALSCFWLARRYGFSRARRIGWAMIGLFFGWVGLILMLVIQEWPARVSCPTCRKLRVVTRDKCEHCGGLHSTPAPDGTEVFDSSDWSVVRSHMSLAKESEPLLGHRT
jgi:hypothetical protein